MISVEELTGHIIFHHWDDDLLMERTNFTFVISAEDSGVPSKWALWETTVLLDFETWSGSAPMFPLSVYKTFVTETTSSGTVVLSVIASSRWGRRGSDWTYSLRDNDEVVLSEPNKKQPCCSDVCYKQHDGRSSHEQCAGLRAKINLCVQRGRRRHKEAIGHSVGIRECYRSRRISASLPTAVVYIPGSS